ncbi:MAG: Flagellar motor switch protein [uncultured bacterium]|nr:MAG: Flagellar motor switch protein [uncultured bacterium]
MSETMGEVTEQKQSGDELALFYEIPVDLKVLLGEATLTIGDILKCSKGSVIPLNQKTGDPFKILLDNKPLAEGEVVEANGQVAIKITNVFKSQENI